MSAPHTSDEDVTYLVDVLRDLADRLEKDKALGGYGLQNAELEWKPRQSDSPLDYPFVLHRPETGARYVITIDVGEGSPGDAN